MSETRVVTEANAGVKSKSLIVDLPIQNPLKVVRYCDGQVIGSATLSFIRGAVRLDLFIDKHQPEALDLDVNPDRVKLSLSGILDAESGMVAVVYLN